MQLKREEHFKAYKIGLNQGPVQLSLGQSPEPQGRGSTVLGTVHGGSGLHLDKGRTNTESYVIGCVDHGLVLMKGRHRPKYLIGELCVGKVAFKSLVYVFVWSRRHASALQINLIGLFVNFVFLGLSITVNMNIR